MSSIKRAGDNAHGFLGIVSAMAQAVSCGREKLQLTKPCINAAWSFVSEQPENGNHEDKGKNEAHNGCNHDKDQSFGPAVSNNDVPAGTHNGCASVATD